MAGIGTVCNGVASQFFPLSKHIPRERFAPKNCLQTILHKFRPFGAEVPFPPAFFKPMKRPHGADR
ncbi:hypothetical protein BN874_1270017 [Candidatus Contendobacter odensis Run_B_J11]|uniref:Uncharacterized protein n=1 Tax=Candidatus Contendobacter odensis Run_B_J11 TaxID=1400861 RepID=A0A7U7J2N5_9GAMM|nr:hypothetical protein BN874_1270017 [Candidatus Contendobacter odensis Run_B_J11]